MSFPNAVMALIILPISILMQILAIPVGLVLTILPAEFLTLVYFCLPLLCKGRATVTYFFGTVSMTFLVALDVYVTCAIIGAMWIIFVMAVLDKIMYVSFLAFSIYCFVSGAWVWGIFCILFIPALLSACNDKIMLVISKREDIVKCIWSIPAGIAMCYLARDVWKCEWLYILVLIATLLPWGMMIYKATQKTHD